MERSFDNLSAIYARLESLAFGYSLEKARNHGLSVFDASRPQSALLLGDGDGRFACRALNANPMLRIDSIDNSQSMLLRAKRRVETLGSKSLNRYNPIEANALKYEYPTSKYDVVVTQFFLDCFESNRANHLISEMAKSLKPHGRLAFADFSIPNKQPWNSSGRFLVAMLYQCFRLATDISARRLPALQWPSDLILESRSEFLKGLLTSEVRIKS